VLLRGRIWGSLLGGGRLDLLGVVLELVGWQAWIGRRQDEYYGFQLRTKKGREHGFSAGAGNEREISCGFND